MKDEMTVPDALDIAGGVLAAFELVGIQTARLTAAGIVITAFGAGYKVGEAINDAADAVEACNAFQQTQCNCGDGVLDAPEETCDFALEGSCFFGDDERQSKYRGAYFADGGKGTWYHGDLVEVTASAGECGGIACHSNTAGSRDIWEKFPGATGQPV